MIKEALEFLAGLGQRANSPHLITDQRLDREHILYTHSGDGMLNTVELSPPPRRHQARSLGGFADLFRHYTDEGIEYPVFAAGGNVVAVLDDADNEHREDTLALRLEVSDEFETLGEMREDRVMRPQSAFILHLRTELAGCVPPDLIALLSQLRQNTQAGAEASVGQGKETFGRTALAHVEARGELPDDVLVSVLVYDQEPESRAEINCCLVIDPSAMTLALIPKAGELQRARNQADKAICDWLEESLGERADVIHGQP